MATGELGACSAAFSPPVGEVRRRVCAAASGRVRYPATELILALTTQCGTAAVLAELIDGRECWT